MREKFFLVIGGFYNAEIMGGEDCGIYKYQSVDIITQMNWRLDTTQSTY